MYLVSDVGALTPLTFDVCPRGMVTCRPAVAITNLIWSHIYRYTLIPVPPPLTQTFESLLPLIESASLNRFTQS